MFLNKNKILIGIIHPFLYLIRKLLSKQKVKKQQKIFNTYGLEALRAFDECLSSHGYSYTLMAGTLLGAVRDNGFIKHDVDIDVAMWYRNFDTNIYKHLENYGFKRKFSYSIDKDRLGKEDSFFYKGINLDIFYIYDPIDELPYLCDFIIQPDFNGVGGYEQCSQIYGGLLPRRIEAPFTDSYKKIKFETLYLPIMDTAEEFLKYRYGEDYMIPNPNWSMVNKNSHIKEWPEKLGKFIVFS